MSPLVENKRAELTELCRRSGVERLYLFGSAAQGRFRESSSDLDFLVKMSDRQPSVDYADRFLALGESLESLFERPVDLITKSLFETPTSGARSKRPAGLCMDNHAKKLLFDVLSSGRSIQEWCEARDFSEYLGDRQFRRAVEREF